MRKQLFPKSLVAGLVIILLLTAAVPAFGAAEKARVFVGFTPGGKAATQQALTAAGADFLYTFDNLNSFVVTVPAKALKGLANNPNITDIEDDVERFPVEITPAKGILAPAADTTFPSGQTVPWGVDAVQARDIWDANNDGSVDAGAPSGAGVNVCIIDTGYYSAHEDLSGASLLGGESQVDNDPFTDGYGHGTHVAGTIAGQDNGLGVIGVAPDVSFYIVKYFDNSGAATFASDLIAAANACANNGADIISMSLGGSRSSGRENRTFNNLYNAGILSIAAAGNDGNTAYSYPASYDSVMSVAAIDEALAIADFSQQNDQVEIAAPGVAVLSTLPFVELNSLTVGGVEYQANHVEFSARGAGSGTLTDGGLCDSVGAWSGQVVLCERGTVSFLDKVANVEAGGGAAAVIYNNEPGNFFGTLGDGASSGIVGLSLSQEDGQFLVANMLGTSASFSSEYIWPTSGYEAWNGTSMATPHVSAVAALLWSANPSATNAEIRDAMNATAFDLGAAGRDVAFGYGLVQAAAAMDFLGGGTPPSNTPPTVSIDSPANGSSFTAGDTVSFSGSASDAEDGNLSGSISWTSSLDGSLGTGASVSAALSTGTHTITASVTDSAGATATDTITVTVSGGGTGGGALHVAVTTDQASYSKGTAQITVSVTDDGGAAVAGASVSVTILTADGTQYSGSATTDATGEATFSYRVNAKKDGSGTYTVDATASLTGYTPGSGSTTFTVQ